MKRGPKGKRKREKKERRKREKAKHDQSAETVGKTLRAWPLPDVKVLNVLKYTLLVSK